LLQVVGHTEQKLRLARSLTHSLTHSTQPSDVHIQNVDEFHAVLVEN